MTCGSKNEYTLNKPVFCGQCGKSFNESAGSAPSPKPAPPAPKTRRKVVEVEEVEAEVIELPSLEGLEIEIIPSQNKGISLKELVCETKTGFEPRKTRKLNKK